MFQGRKAWVYQMLKGGISDPRNKSLMKMFNMIGIGERAGSGVPNIYSVWETYGWETPTVKEQYNPDRTILTLSFIPKQADKTSRKNRQLNTLKNTATPTTTTKTKENKQAILSFLTSEGSSKSTDIARQIGLSPARTRALLLELTRDGQIHAAGNGRSRRYHL